MRAEASDTRILGDGEFVQELKSDLDNFVKKNLRLSGRQVDIVTLAGRICKKHGISLGELRSGSRRREIVEARGIVSWIAVRELGYTGAVTVHSPPIFFQKIEKKGDK